MPDPVILTPSNRNLEPDVVAIARQMLPSGFVAIRSCRPRTRS